MHSRDTVQPSPLPRHHCTLLPWLSPLHRESWAFPDRGLWEALYSVGASQTIRDEERETPKMRRFVNWKLEPEYLSHKPKKKELVKDGFIRFLLIYTFTLTYSFSWQKLILKPVQLQTVQLHLYISWTWSLQPRRQSISCCSCQLPASLFARREIQLYDLWDSLGAGIRLFWSRRLGSMELFGSH